MTDQRPKPRSRRVKNRVATKWLGRSVGLVAGGVLALLLFWQSRFDPYSWFVNQGWKSPPVPIAPVPDRSPSTKMASAPPAPHGSDSSLSSTALGLILVSASPGKSNSEGSAQIGTTLDSPQTYQAGALLENGARLSEIHADHVLLTKGHKSLQLYVSSLNRRNTGDPILAQVGRVQDFAPVQSEKSSREVVLDYVRASPRYRGETLVGFQVYAGFKPGVFSQMSLRDGDLITALDGTPVIDAAVTWNQLHALGEGALLSATVDRGGVIQTVSLDGSLILHAEEVGALPIVQSPLPPAT